ncbi:MAG: tetratricopeptide repeat protein, partial [Flavobacteriales bacterium]
FNEFVASLEHIKIDKAEVDEANFEAAENKFLDKNYKTAATALKKYLGRFETPNYKIDALFYLAESELKTGNTDKALTYYKKVIDSRLNKFTVPSLITASRITFSNNDHKAALSHYISLEKAAKSEDNIKQAIKGQMRSYFQLKQYDKAIKQANRVAKFDKLTQNAYIGHHMIKARSLYELEQYDSSITYFNKVADTTTSEDGAKAKYWIAKAHYEQEEYKETEDAVFRLIRHKPSYEKWVGKGFLLLADNYVKMDDLFQAKESLGSMIKNINIKNLKNKAESKLKKIESMQEQEKRESKLEKQELEIDLGDINEENSELFEDIEEPGDSTKSKNKEK